MACRYTYKGKTYEVWEFDDLLRAMPVAEAAAFMPTVKSVPSAPFVGKTDAWAELAIKQVLRMAAEGGYDAVAWTSGTQQKERYNLSKQINSIKWMPSQESGTKNVRIDPKDAGLIRFTVNANGVIGKDFGSSFAESEYTGKQLDAVVGKDVADKIMAHGDGSLNGEGLNIGGEGMIGFYDRILPNLFKKVAGRMDKSVAVGKTSLALPVDDYGRTAKYIGPTRTLAEVEDLYRLSSLSGRDIFDNPITGKREDYAINRVMNEQPLRRARDEMLAGKSFAEAMASPNISSDVAELFGGKIEHAATEDGATQPSIPITDKMRESALSGQPLFSQGEPSEFELENQRIREEDKTLWNKAKREMRRQLTPAGLLPDSVFKSKIARDNKLAVVEFDAAHLIGNLERAIRRDYGVHAGKLSTPDLNALSEALGGKIPASVKGQTKAALIAMRQYIDDQSKQYIQILREQVTGMAGQLDEGEQALLQAFLSMSRIDNSTGTAAEKGQATKQRNAILDDAKAQAKELWGDGKQMQESLGRVATLAEKISLIETITANEGTYVHRSYQAFDDPDWPRKVPDKVLNDARTYLMKRLVEQDEMTPEAAQRRARVLIEDILKEGTAYDNLESFIKESKLGAKDLSVLKARKKIAPEIRALLGEHMDPRLNFAKSVTKMGRLIWNQRFLDRVREVGMGSFLFTEENRPPNTTKIAAEGSEVYSPLNGLYAEREVVQAFKDALGKEQMANWYKTIVQINGVVKYGKTILSPTTAARNWQSAMFFTIANGHFDWTQMGKSVSGLKEYFLHAGSAEKLNYLRKLKDLGVVYDTAYAGEMMRLLDDSKIENMINGSDSALGIRKTLELAQKFYQYGDDFWKIIGFENEKNMLMKHAGLTKEAAEIEAAERIRNTYPTYSMVGKGVQSLRRFPLVGTFVSFPAEIIRTSFNMLKYLHQDWQNPKTRPMAVKRAVGLSIASGFAYALQAMSKSLFDIDDDDEEAIRLQAAPWQQNSNLIFVGRDEQGKMRYYDISFLDPYGYWKRPINAIMRDQPWQDEAVSAVGEMLKPFLGTDILAGAIFEVAANKKDTGGEVYKETDSADRQLVDIANHLRKSLQPGIASNLERTWKAMQGETSASGQKYNLHDEALGWVGWRVTTLDPKVALYYRSFDFNDAKSDASRTLTQVLTSPNDVDDEDITDAYELAVKMREQAYGDMAKMVSASKRSGMSNAQIRTTLQGASVSQADINGLLSGSVPRWVPTAQSERSAVRRAEAILGPDKAREIRERYRTARRAASE